MRIGIPREIKTMEARVPLVPAACADLAYSGHQVLIESGAGEKSGFSDQEYEQHGVKVVPDAATLYGSAELIVKVKEPVAGDLQYLQRDHLLFCYLHLAAEPELTRRLLDIGLTGVAFETVERADGSLPLLAPMSNIAGRIAVQVGTHLLHVPPGGKGLLLGGVPAAERGKAVLLGAGAAGSNSARLLAASGAQVIVFDKRPDRLEEMMELAPNVTALYPYEERVAAEVADADILVGAVLVTGARAPHVVSEEMVRRMEPGSVVVDISVDQGGCIATTKPTTYAEPTYSWEGVTHFAVTNMPGAVPRTASQALSAALLPYVQRITRSDWAEDERLSHGINVRAGKLVHPALQDMELG